jgi:hypothetical protein
VGGIGISGLKGIYEIPLEGLINETRYKIGTYSGGAWSWSAADDFVYGATAYDVSLAAITAADGAHVYAVWTHDGKPELSLHWDTEEPPFDLTPYWVRGTDLALEWHVDGSFNTLSFILAHGHLFDSFNVGSAWQKYVSKGRKLTVRLGENILGTAYWQNQGTFLVTERKMSGYERGKYPTLTVTAEDRRTVWQHMDVVATDAYSDMDPDAIIQDLLIDQGVAAAGDFAWGTIDNETQLDHQWTEMPLLDIVSAILDRYGYFLAVTVDDEISARKIALDNAVDHVYGDTTQLLSFSPDDTFSDFTNRVTVIGQERTFTEVTYAEECVQTLNGTVGWWGYNNDFTIWYSDDHARVCRNPRLKVIETAT